MPFSFCKRLAAIEEPKILITVIKVVNRLKEEKNQIIFSAGPQLNGNKLNY